MSVSLELHSSVGLLEVFLLRWLQVPGATHPMRPEPQRDWAVTGTFTSGHGLFGRGKRGEADEWNGTTRPLKIAGIIR